MHNIILVIQSYTTIRTITLCHLVWSNLLRNNLTSFILIVLDCFVNGLSQ